MNLPSHILEIISTSQRATVVMETKCAGHSLDCVLRERVEMGPRNRAVVQPLAPDSPMDAFGAGWWEGSLGTRGGGGGVGWVVTLPG